MSNEEISKEVKAEAANIGKKLNDMDVSVGKVSGNHFTPTSAISEQKQQELDAIDKQSVS